MRIRWSLCVLVLLALGQVSCAPMYTVPMQESMPAARAGLAPEHRIFYDALADYGDWVLLEPFGYVFRPYGTGAGWRPYQNGYWAPSDVYGWVWVSAEPYGWATYHYGSWLYDDYRGWLWIPGNEWGPAWVEWEQTAHYVGWCPVAPPGYTLGVPGGAYLYVPAAELAAPDLKTRTMTADRLRDRLHQPHPVRNIHRHEGVSFNRGPDIGWIESLSGRLRRVQIEDAAGGETVDGRPRPGAEKPPRPVVKDRQDDTAAGTPSDDAARPPRPVVKDKQGGSDDLGPGSDSVRPPRPQAKTRRSVTPPDSVLVRDLKRGAEESAREAREATEGKDRAPANIKIIRPRFGPDLKGPGKASKSSEKTDGQKRVIKTRGRSAPAPAPADTLKIHKPQTR